MRNCPLIEILIVVFVSDPLREEALSLLEDEGAHDPALVSVDAPSPARGLEPEAECGQTRTQASLRASCPD